MKNFILVLTAFASSLCYADTHDSINERFVQIESRLQVLEARTDQRWVCSSFCGKLTSGGGASSVQLVGKGSSASKAFDMLKARCYETDPYYFLFIGTEKGSLIAATPANSCAGGK
jgi:hypothetical protein